MLRGALGVPDTARPYEKLGITDTAVSAVARPNGQPRQAGVARGVRGHAPPPPRNFEL